MLIYQRTVIGIVILGFILTGGWYYNSLHWQVVKIFNPNLSFVIPNKYQHLSTEKMAGDSHRVDFLFRAQDSDPETPTLVSLRKETGLGFITALVKKSPLEMILSNSSKSWPLRFPDFKQESLKKINVAGRDAAEIIFTYTGPTGARLKQRYLIVIYDESAVLYLNAQTLDSQFNQLNGLYFKKIFASFLQNF